MERKFYINEQDDDSIQIYIFENNQKYVINENKEYIPLTGNMSALLILEYILEQRKEKNTLPENGVAVKSIVSSTMAYPICKEYNIKLEEINDYHKYPIADNNTPQLSADRLEYSLSNAFSASI